MAERVTALGEATSLADRKRRAGQRLLIGFERPFVDDDLRALVREIRPAGFVLFGRNVEDPEQVAELNRELASLVDPHYPALLAVDQEGGRVQRVRAPATVWPPMREVGRAQAHTAQVSRAMALELRAMGFNLNFAPVADVDSNPDNPVIGDRSFDRRPEVVAQHVVDFIEAHQAQGVIACAKHFPGHGDTTVDSHKDLPRVERDRPDLEHVELTPFKAAVAAGVGSIMTSHVVYPAWDEDWPATLSPRIIEGILRRDMGYEGLVFSDDLEMKAVAGRYPLRLQVERMTRATVDVLLCCRDPGLQYAAFLELVHMQEHDAGLQQTTIDAVRRVDATRVRFFKAKRPPPDPERIGHHEHTTLAAMVRSRGAA